MKASIKIHNKLTCSNYSVTFAFSLYLVSRHSGSLYHLHLRLVFGGPGRLGPAPTCARHQSCDRLLHVFHGRWVNISYHTWKLGRLRCIRSRGSEQTQMDDQQ